MRDISEIHNLGNTYERILLVTKTNHVYIGEYTDGTITVSGEVMNHSAFQKWCAITYLKMILGI